jgi:hypothetical protein
MNGKLIKTATIVAVTAALVAPAALATAGQSSAPTIMQGDTSETTRGLVKSFDKTKKTFIITTAGETAKDVTITVNDATVYMKDGKVSTFDELVKTGSTLTVTHKKGAASKVESFTTP